MSKVKSYLSLIKFSHTIFAMPFALIGFSLGLIKWNLELPGLNLNETIGWAPKSFNITWDQILLKLLLVILCMAFARSAAMAFNRYLDRSFDAKNPRTAIREIPAGILKADNVLFFTIISCLLFIACTFFINKICLFLSPIALFVVLGYSYTKRFTPLCHLILGLGLSLAPIGAYLAVTGRFDFLPILFSFTVLFWVSSFDIIYALQDEQFDRQHHLNSIPETFGASRALFLSRNLHAASSLFLLGAGISGKLSWLYFAGWIIFSSMLVMQHRLVKANDLSRVNIAFATTNGIASVLFGLITIISLLIFRA